MTPLIECKCCNGEGKRELPPEMLSSYHALKQVGPAPVSKIAAKLGVELTNAHHRVKRLVSLGVARRVNKKFPAIYKAV